MPHEADNEAVSEEFAAAMQPPFLVACPTTSWPSMLAASWGSSSPSAICMTTRLFWQVMHSIAPPLAAALMYAMDKKCSCFWRRCHTLCTCLSMSLYMRRGSNCMQCAVVALCAGNGPPSLNIVASGAGCVVGVIALAPMVWRKKLTPSTMDRHQPGQL